MRYKIWFGIFAFLFMLSMVGTSQNDSASIVNFMIDVTVPASATEDQAKIVQKNLDAMYREINNQNLKATIFSTRDAVDSYVRLGLGNIGLSANFELAMSGESSNDTISDKSYTSQMAILKKSKEFVELCRICGRNDITVKGFMPQNFNQNPDTYKVLDDLGIRYNAGFQAGLIYDQGHENDVWPYELEGQKVYAVPLSTYTLSGKKVVLQDRYFKDNGLGADQWYNALVSKYDEIQGKNEPLVISFTTDVSGSGDYFDAFKRFVDYVKSKNASSVTTNQLVEMAMTGLSDASKLPVELSSECKDCGQTSELEISVNMNNTNQTEAVSH